MSNWINAKTVIEDADVQISVNKYSTQFERFEDLWDGLKWLLARKAH